MDRAISIRTRRNLQTRMTSDAFDGRERDSAKIIWLSQYRRRPVASATSSSVASQISGIDACWTLARWMLNATIDGFALYAASYYASDLYPERHSSPDNQTDVSA